MKTSSVRIWRRKRNGDWETWQPSNNLGHHSDHAASLVVREVSKLPVNVRPLQGCSSTTPSWKERTPGCNRVGHCPVMPGVLVLVHHPLSLLHVEPLPRVDLRVDVVRGDVGDVLGEALIEPHLVPPEDIHLARGGKVDSPVQCDNVAELGPETGSVTLTVRQCCRTGSRGRCRNTHSVTMLPNWVQRQVP